jgi:cyclohexyl-isocyanide hydratase
MKIAFITYDGLTALDFVGIYDPLTRLGTMGFMPDLSWDICATTETVTDAENLKFVPTRIEPFLSEYDLIVVPGGFGTRALIEDTHFINWLKTASACKYKTSVCTGSLLLGAAGFLQGKAATSHPTALDQLRKFTPDVRTDRIVDQGDVITAGGVAASIDLGLYLCQKIAGPDTKQRIKHQMDYPYGD